MDRPSVEAAPGIVIPRKFVIPPAVLANRMQRYAVYLIVCAFVLMLANVRTAVILNAVQWNFERLREDLMTGGRQAVDMHDPAES
jgi:hypothetical protein